MINKLKKKIISVYIVFILITVGFMGILVFDGVVDEGSVSAATTRYVGPGQLYSTIGAAIAAANPGDTVRVYAGTYYENITIDKSISLIGNGSTNTIINGSGIDSVVTIASDWVNITGFAVTDSGSKIAQEDAGIKLKSLKKCKIMNNKVSFNNIGIDLWKCSENTISNNLVTLNDRQGVFFGGGPWCSRNTIANNTISSNGFGGFVLSYGLNNLIINNTVTPDNYAGNYISNSRNNIIIDNTFSHTGEGLRFYNCRNNTIINNTFSENGVGLEFLSSTQHTTINNNCSSNSGSGIYLDGSSSNTFNNNIVSLNVYGFKLYMSNNNDIYHNNIINNTNQLNQNRVNNWDNGNGEGNYWSDYPGIDIDGDGIGDTNLSHNNADYYPFMKYNGWLYPRKPKLHNLAEHCYDGNYSLNWFAVSLITEYILEESNNTLFTSSNEIKTMVPIFID